MAILRIKGYEKAEVVELSLVMDGPNVVVVGTTPGSEFPLELAVFSDKGIQLLGDIPPSFPLPVSPRGRLFIVVN